MPNFIPTDTFDNVPSLEDGKPANAAYLNAPHQALVNRTHNLNETIKASGLTRDGATRIRFVESPTEMATTLGMKRGDVCVASNAGAYVFWGPLGGSPAPAPWAYESGTEPGSYWVHSTFGITDRAGTPGGIVTLDHEGRIRGTLGAVTLEGPLTIGPGGSIRQRMIMVEPATPGTNVYDFSCSAAVGDIFVAAIPGDAPACKLLNEGAFAGARIKVARATGGRLSVKNANDDTLWSVIWDGTAWNNQAAEFLYANTDIGWIRVQ